MRGAVMAAAVGALVLVLGACGGEDAGAPARVEAHDAWVRPAPAPGPSAAYLRIVNPGDRDDRLLAVESEVAGSAQLHETLHEGGMMRMRHRPEGFAVPAGGELVLEPGGRHVMLHDLVRDLAPGERVPLVLRFERAGPVRVEAEVRHGEDGHAH